MVLAILRAWQAERDAGETFWSWSARRSDAELLAMTEAPAAVLEPV
jgi:hypothetical protein